MTAKEYLRQYYDLTKEIEILDAEIADLTAEIETTNKTLDGMPKGSNIADKTGSMAVKLADLSAEVQGMRDKALEERKKVLDVVLSISKEPYARLLYNRYITFKRFEQIAVDMGYSYSRTIHLHGEALMLVQEKLAHDSTLDCGIVVLSKNTNP